MDVKSCPRCNLERPVESFAKRRGGRRTGNCLPCRTELNRLYYRNSGFRERQLARRRAAYVRKPRPAAVDRFWAKVTRADGDECWEWQGATNQHGYGIFYPVLRNRKMLAHRYSLTLATGREPPDCVLHRCDNPRCVRPDHLFLGSRSDNAADKVSKGRQSGAQGEANSKARLCAEQVLEIRRQAAAGKSRSQLARDFKVSLRNMRQIVDGQTWKHLLVGE